MSAGRRSSWAAAVWATMLLVLGCHLTQRTLQAKRPATSPTRVRADTPPADGLTAMGTEPFWHLTISSEGKLFFKTLAGDSLRTPPVRGLREPNRRATRYRAETEAGRIEVVVYDEPCQNPMSGQLSPRRVEVTHHGTTYRGCGRPAAGPAPPR